MCTYIAPLMYVCLFNIFQGSFTHVRKCVMYKLACSCDVLLACFAVAAITMYDWKTELVYYRHPLSLLIILIVCFTYPSS